MGGVKWGVKMKDKSADGEIVTIAEAPLGMCSGEIDFQGLWGRMSSDNVTEKKISTKVQQNLLLSYLIEILFDLFIS